MTVWPNGDPQRVVRAVLADPRFARGPQSAAVPSWPELIGRWLRRVFELIFARVDHVLGGRSSLIEWFVVLVLAAAVAFVVVRVVQFGLRRALVRQPSPTFDAGASTAAGPRLSADAWRGRAREAFARGERREAAAMLFLALVTALDERGRLPFDAARTPGDVRRLAADPRVDAFVGAAIPALYAAAPPPDEVVRALDAAYAACFE